MYAVRRSVLVLVGATVLAGCGSSITEITPRSARPTPAAAATPFCEAIARSQAAAQPVSRWRAGQKVENVGEVADQVRVTNQQVSALAPPELRADADRVVGVVDRQLRLLEGSGGDTLALRSDPGLEQATADPGYTAASRRISDYVRTSC